MDESNQSARALEATALARSLRADFPSDFLESRPRLIGLLKRAAEHLEREAEGEEERLAGEVEHFLTVQMRLLSPIAASRPSVMGEARDRLQGALARWKAKRAAP